MEDKKIIELFFARDEEAIKAIVDNPRELLQNKGILWNHPNF